MCTATSYSCALIKSGEQASQPNEQTTSYEVESLSSDILTTEHVSFTG